MTDDLRNTIVEAAQMRSGGATWQMVAQKCKRSPETCRQWPRRYPEIWAPLRAENQAPDPVPSPRKAAGTVRHDPREANARTSERPFLPDPLLIFRMMARMRAAPMQSPRPYAAPTARVQPAAPPANPPLPIAKPAPMVHTPPTPSQYKPRLTPITSANLVMAAITAVSLGFAFGSWTQRAGILSQGPATKVVPITATGTIPVTQPVKTDGDASAMRAGVSMISTRVSDMSEPISPHPITWANKGTNRSPIDNATILLHLNPLTEGGACP